MILVEYLGDTHDTLFNHLEADKALNTLSKPQILESLQAILEKLRGLNFVHGDFNSCNIFAKPFESRLEDFKLVEFELSGKE